MTLHWGVFGFGLLLSGARSCVSVALLRSRGPVHARSRVADSGASVDCKLMLWCAALCTSAFGLCVFSQYASGTGGVVDKFFIENLE